MKVYLDNAATTKVDPEVLEAMKPYFNEEYGNPNSIHSWGQRARIAVDEAREKVARALNAKKSQEIIFTSCASEANNLAIKGVVEYAQLNDPRFKNGKLPHLIVSPIEHHCVFDTAKYLEETGQAEVSWLKVDEHGLVDPAEIKSEIKEETVLVSVMYVNNEVGTIEPIREIAEAISSQKLKADSRPASPAGRPLFHTDAVQAIEYLDCDVQKLGIDLLGLSGHKFHTPKGVGALYIREGVKLIPQVHGGGQEYQLRAGTENVPYIVGLGKAIEIATGDSIALPRKTRAKEKPLGFAGSNPKGLGIGAGEKVKRVQKLRDNLIEGVPAKIPKTKLTGHPKKRAPHIASFVFPGAEGEAMLLLLDREGIAASSGSACTSGTLEPSHVLLAMGISKEDAHTSLRLSLSKHTTEEEIDYVLEKLPGIIERLRKMAPR